MVNRGAGSQINFGALGHGAIGAWLSRDECRPETRAVEDRSDSSM
jgi:hypothetical protein